MTRPDERFRIISAARSVCWESVGRTTEDLSDVQCLIRASVSVARRGTEAETFLDLAEEIAGEPT